MKHFPPIVGEIVLNVQQLVLVNNLNSPTEVNDCQNADSIPLLSD